MLITTSSDEKQRRATAVRDHSNLGWKVGDTTMAQLDKCGITVFYLFIAYV